MEVFVRSTEVFVELQNWISIDFFSEKWTFATSDDENLQKDL